jgi:hypothetical protein
MFFFKRYYVFKLPFLSMVLLVIFIRLFKLVRGYIKFRSHHVELDLCVYCFCETEYILEIYFYFKIYYNDFL